MAWEGVKIAALHATPLGPAAVAGCYLARQVGYALLGFANGDGFIVEASIPLSFVPGVSAVPEQFELTVHARVFGRRTGPISEIGIEPEIQIYHQWVEEIDVSRAGVEERTIGIPPVTDATAHGSQDPWEEWLNLYGRALIQDLARALATRSGTLPIAP
jgi:hypothetical protein